MTFIFVYNRRKINWRWFILNRKNLTFTKNQVILLGMYINEILIYKELSIMNHLKKNQIKCPADLVKLNKSRIQDSSKKKIGEETFNSEELQELKLDFYSALYNIKQDDPFFNEYDIQNKLLAQKDKKDSGEIANSTHRKTIEKVLRFLSSFTVEEIEDCDSYIIKSLHRKLSARPLENKTTFSNITYDYEELLFMETLIICPALHTKLKVKQKSDIDYREITECSSDCLNMVQTIIPIIYTFTDEQFLKDIVSSNVKSDLNDMFIMDFDYDAVISAIITLIEL